MLPLLSVIVFSSCVVEKVCGRGGGGRLVSSSGSGSGLGGGWMGGVMVCLAFGEGGGEECDELITFGDSGGVGTGVGWR